MEAQSKTKKKKPASRSTRWGEAIGDVQKVLSQISTHLDDLEEACAALRAVQEEYEQWKDSLPENLQSSGTGEKLKAIYDLEIEDAANNVRTAVDEFVSFLEDADGMELPQGFGRD